jgi:iron complex outermembrane receptor protein
MKATGGRRGVCRAGGIWTLAFCTLCATSPIGQAGAQENNPSFSMEQLVNMDVSSVARREQKLYKTPAAVFVITRDDIQRSGADNIPEVLRMVPGLQVAQEQANLWAVSSRGFNSTVANKMLVMIDGRSIYNLDWSGTYWDMNEVPLDIVERIEVIRGPGATMWGANAVDGVINIITMKAQKTLGAVASGSVSRTARSAELRYGAALENNFWFRAFAKYQKQPALLLADGSSANDAGRAERAGIRLDWEPNAKDAVYLHGDAYRGREDQQEFGPQLERVQDKTSNNGGYALVRWEHRMSGSDTALQFYYDDQNRWEQVSSGRVGSMDVDFQHHISSISRNEVTWGVGVRMNHDHIKGSPASMFHDKHQVMLYSSFVQDEIALDPGKVVLTAGSKFDWNTYTHFEWQPSVRLLWTPDPQHSIWAAVSRAVRTPSFRDRDLNLYLPLGLYYSIPMVSNLHGNPDFKSEDAISYEAGYRQKITRRLSADLAGYFVHYTRLETDAPGQEYMVYSPSPEIIVPVTFTNQAKANTQGLEALLLWSPAASLHLRGGYSWLQCQQTSNSTTILPEGNWATPRNTVTAIGSWDFIKHWSLDSALYAVSTLPAGNAQTEQKPIPAYRRVDVSLTYAPANALNIRVGARNLQSAQHFEFNPQGYYVTSSAIPRSVYAKFEWRF